MAYCIDNNQTSSEDIEVV